MEVNRILNFLMYLQLFALLQEKEWGMSADKHVTIFDVERSFVMLATWRLKQLNCNCFVIIIVFILFSSSNERAKFWFLTERATGSGAKK